MKINNTCHYLIVHSYDTNTQQIKTNNLKYLVVYLTVYDSTVTQVHTQTFFYNNFNKLHIFHYFMA